MDNSFIALGLMSGTSLDGIDASIIKSDGEDNLDIIDNKYLNYPDEFRKRLSTFILNINNRADIEKNISSYKSLERDLTLYHSKISKKILSDNNLKAQLIGFHGQTIIHKPKDGYSIQMGDANLLSQELKEKVIYNFRANDIKNGGEGAPLTSIYHKLLIKKFKINNPTLILNIGGISNYTYFFKNILASKDIGPGNVLMDEYLKKTKGIDYDKNGDIASSGNINIDIINQFYEHEFYNVQQKHSFDRNEFDFSFVKGLEFEDAVATLTYFTALIISQNIKKNFDNEIEIILCGGGRRNLALVNHIKKLLKYKIKLIDEFSVDGDFIESQAFAYLSIRSYLNKIISYPSTTNVLNPVTGGEIKINF
ncbi:anhydro-N-acetylmuramic acid kinase [Candidatus Pelagibacter sp.]|nr:anhydro-N-acetylmuramic acid kinase [Candidatus Pelagibacter sp.]